MLILSSGVFKATIGFSASYFQPPRASCFLAKFAEKYFFRHYSLLVTIKDALGEEAGLGAHGDVIFVSRRTSAEPWVELRLVWSHNVVRPYGTDVTLQCVNCRALRPWSPPRFSKQPEAVTIACKFCCHATTYAKPVNFERDGKLGRVGGGEWFVTRRVLS